LGGKKIDELVLAACKANNLKNKKLSSMLCLTIKGLQLTDMQQTTYGDC